jgi:IrrE N-terminal-like domain
VIPRIGQAFLVSIALGAQPGWSQEVRPVVSVREVADSSLQDVAVAVADPRDPVIYYNPRLMTRFGPNLSAFVMAHEYGHIEYGHRRVSARVTERAALMRQFELEADCYAARMLARVKPEAADVAIEFFLKMGDFRYDDDHPTGNERANMIRTCLEFGPGDRSRDALSVGIGAQVVASLSRFEGTPGPMAMLKSATKLGTRKATERLRKLDTGVRRERLWSEMDY